MNGTKLHTSGPWHTVADNTQVNAGEQFIARVHWGHATSTQADANARLIAAAPDLLEALERLEKEVADLRDGITWSRDNADVVTAHMQARNAIRKAKGE